MKTFTFGTAGGTTSTTSIEVELTSPRIADIARRAPENLIVDLGPPAVETHDLSLASSGRQSTLASVDSQLYLIRFKNDTYHKFI
jgi:hypothetical protein